MRTAEITVDLLNDDGKRAPVTATVRETETGHAWESDEPTLASILTSFTVYTFPQQAGYQPDYLAGLAQGAAELFPDGRVSKAPAALDYSTVPEDTVF